MLQGAGFTGAAAGVNLARDIEIGLFDRFLASPAPRWALLAGIVLSASVRSLVPGTVLLIVALAVGADFPGIGGLIVAFALVMGMAADLRGRPWEARSGRSHNRASSKQRSTRCCLLKRAQRACCSLLASTRSASCPAGRTLPARS
jgi:hypothetical protein